MLAVLLLVCGIYALIVVPGAVDGLKYYFVPDFSKFGMHSSQMHVCRYVSLLVLDGVSLQLLVRV
ncbi:MAG: hypothetical protein V8Q92_12690 [Coprococcus comes]